MNNRNFDRMTQNEKKQRFKKAVDDYDRGYLETDGEVLRTVISVRVEEALDDAGRTFDEFSENQKSLIFEAARENLNLEHYMNPDFSENHMKFIMEHGSMAVKIRYKGYLKALADIKNKKSASSTKESVLEKLKSMKDRDFSMNIPVGEEPDDE